MAKLKCPTPDCCNMIDVANRVRTRRLGTLDEIEMEPYPTCQECYDRAAKASGRDAIAQPDPGD